MNNILKKNQIVLEFLVFICGMTVMVLEILGSRIMAPYFGNSIIVWTNIIGVIMLSLSIGYYFGGWLADKNPQETKFINIILLSGLTITAIAPIYPRLFPWIQQHNWQLAYSSMFGVVSIMSIPNIFLGMVLPYATKLYTKNMERLAKSVGRLYALSTVGGIIGVFITGFYLIPSLGCKNLILLLGIVLILSALLGQTISRGMMFFSAIIVVIFVFFPNYNAAQNGQLLAIKESLYNTLKVYQKENNNQVHRFLMANNQVHSSICVSCENFLDNSYKIYEKAFCVKPDINNVLIVGGGGYSMATDILRSKDISSLDVVEIDPMMTALAQQYFELDNNDPRLSIYHEDGRVFLNQEAGKKYDLIIMDVYLNSYAIPFHLTTIENVKRIQKQLSTQGIVMLNLVSALEGDRSKFWQAEYKTYQQVFSNLFIYPENYNQPEKEQNIFLFATNNPWYDQIDCKIKVKDYFYEDTDKNTMILSDDFAPVDNLLLNI